MRALLSTALCLCSTLASAESSPYALQIEPAPYVLQRDMHPYVLQDTSAKANGRTASAGASRDSRAERLEQAWVLKEMRYQERIAELERAQGRPASYLRTGAQDYEIRNADLMRERDACLYRARTLESDLQRIRTSAQLGIVCPPGRATPATTALPATCLAPGWP